MASAPLESHAAIGSETQADDNGFGHASAWNEDTAPVATVAPSHVHTDTPLAQTPTPQPVTAGEGSASSRALTTATLSGPVRRRAAARSADAEAKRAVTSVWNDLEVTQVPVGTLRAYKNNPRKHSEQHIARLMASVLEFGFLFAVLVDKNGEVIAGHALLEAARRLSMETVPVARVGHLTRPQVKALRLAHNKLAEGSEWDFDRLRVELDELVTLDLRDELSFDVSVTGFLTPEIDLILDGAGGPSGTADPPVDLEALTPKKYAVSRLGDLWRLGMHWLLCGDALDPRSYALVMAGELARQIFTDPPYNVPVVGHVRTGQGGGHREFAMGVGEMSETEFEAFLRAALREAAEVALDGAILMVAMDWRSIDVLIRAGKTEGLSLINVAVWNKTNGGMGSLYRSKHELFAVFKKGHAPHVNNVELGRHGRYRTNVWDYAGVNTFRKGRKADLVDHPTCKPVPLIMDAIKDVTHRGDIVLDPFGGSGSTLLAAERTARQARLIELDPLYVDVAIRRWQALTGQQAVLDATGETFAEREAALAPETEKGSAGVEARGGAQDGPDLPHTDREAGDAQA